MWTSAGPALKQYSNIVNIFLEDDDDDNDGIPDVDDLDDDNDGIPDDGNGK